MSSFLYRSGNVINDRTLLEPSYFCKVLSSSPGFNEFGDREPMTRSVNAWTHGATPLKLLRARSTSATLRATISRSVYYLQHYTQWRNGVGQYY